MSKTIVATAALALCGATPVLADTMHHHRAAGSHGHHASNTSARVHHRHVARYGAMPARVAGPAVYPPAEPAPGVVGEGVGLGLGLADTGLGIGADAVGTGLDLADVGVGLGTGAADAGLGLVTPYPYRAYPADRGLPPEGDFF